jgi:hypothetical protein
VVAAPGGRTSVPLSFAPSLLTEGIYLPREMSEGTLDAMPVCVVLLLDDALILVFGGLPAVGRRGENLKRAAVMGAQASWSSALRSRSLLSFRKSSIIPHSTGTGPNGMVSPRFVQDDCTAPAA